MTISIDGRKDYNSTFINVEILKIIQDSTFFPDLKEILSAN